MTSDAKIGLLLGLVFICIIAFIINGLPGFGKNVDSNELTNTYISNLQTDSLDITNKARKAAEVINRHTDTKRDTIRFAAPLPKKTVAAAKNVTENPVAVEKPTTDTSKRDKIQFYIVKEGDSLWRIARTKLGDGSRYTEILSLNRKIIVDEDSLTVGMRLRLPGR